MKIWKGLVVLWCLPLATAFLAGMAFAVDNVMVTDVTTRSFSVVWTADEPSTAGLEVYEDEEGTVAAAEAVITPHPVLCGGTNAEDIKNLAEDLGVMKVQVTGLSSNTDYWFRTTTISKADPTQITAYPDPSSPPMPVKTETLTVRATAAGIPFSNDIIIADGMASGTVLIASLTGGGYPVSAFVGDCIATPAALVDLNNVFGRTTGENLDLSQGVNLAFLNLGAPDDATMVVYKVPVDNSLAEIKSPDPGMDAGWNMFATLVQPDDNAIETVTGPLIPPSGTELLSIWQYDEGIIGNWRTYFAPPADQGANNLAVLDAHVGYWLNLSAPASLKITGVFDNSPIQLNVGWNMVGCNSLRSMKVEEIFGSHDTPNAMTANINSIWSHDASLVGGWRTYFPDSADTAVNNLEYLEPGKAYWINAGPGCSQAPADCQL